MITIEGNIRKMRVENKNPIQYFIVLSDKNIPINEHIGSIIKFKEVSLDEAEKLFKFYNLETNNLVTQIS